MGDTLERLEGWKIWKWDESGKILIFVNENKVVEAIEQLGKRKITVASFKRNMTMFGFNIVERGQLNYQNPEYTKENRAENKAIIKKRVQEKNKMDNDNKKRKTEQKQQQIVHAEIKKARLCDETKTEISANILKQTASIIQNLPLSNSSSPMNSFEVESRNLYKDIIIPRISIVLHTSQTENTSVSNSINELVTENEKELVIVKDEIADTADDAETQENNIDPPIVNIIPNLENITFSSSRQEIEINRLSYAVGLQHKQAECQSLLSLQNQQHEKEKIELKREIIRLEKMVKVAYDKGLQQGLNNATAPILSFLIQLNPNIFPKNTKFVNSFKK